MELPVTMSKIPNTCAIEAYFMDISDPETVSLACYTRIQGVRFSLFIKENNRELKIMKEHRATRIILFKNFQLYTFGNKKPEDPPLRQHLLTEQLVFYYHRSF